MSSRAHSARGIEPGHEHLVGELASLPESERRAVVRAADERAHRRARSIASRQTIEGLLGLVHEEGDAVEDCQRVWER